MREKVYELLCQIPKGKVTTYKILGAKLWIHPRAIWVYMRTNKDPVKFPCYKVVTSDWKIWNYLLWVDKKVSLLKNDGIKMVDWKVTPESYYYF